MIDTTTDNKDLIQANKARGLKTLAGITVFHEVGQHKDSTATERRNSVKKVASFHAGHFSSNADYDRAVSNFTKLSETNATVESYIAVAHNRTTTDLHRHCPSLVGLYSGKNKQKTKA